MVVLLWGWIKVVAMVALLGVASCVVIVIIWVLLLLIDYVFL